MGSARYIIADVFEALESLPDNSVDLVFSSPPFLALRSYLPADHPNKAKEIGSEATPADFLDTLLDVVEACDRVLAPHGSLCFELGDTFAGSGGAGGDYNEGGLREGQPTFKQRTDGGRFPAGYVVNDGRATPKATDYGAFDVRPIKGRDGWPLPKSLCGIPTLFAWSLAYGRNLLRPERALRGTDPCPVCDGGIVEPHPLVRDSRCTACDGTGRAETRWRIRNVVVWARPNPPVGALGDKFRPATSYLTVACKSDKRWFDLDAVRTESATSGEPTGRGWNGYSDGAMPRGPGGYKSVVSDGGINNPAGAPPLDYWEIPTHPFPGSHYATFPPNLCVRPVKAMCPSKVCRVCGEPSRRIVAEQPQATAQEAIAALIEDRRTALGITRAEMVPWFIDRYKNADSVTAQVSNWERAKNVPSPEDWQTLKERLGISAEFDAVITGERTWTESSTTYEELDGTPADRAVWTSGVAEGKGAHSNKPNGLRAVTNTLGWTDCDCTARPLDVHGTESATDRPSRRLSSKWRNGVVLDPFAGSGTTLAVATGHGRDAIGIDLDSRNAELALERVGPLFLTIETLEESKPFAPPAEDVETEIV